MDKTFSGFDELIKNCPKYITLCICQTIGQGLVDDYRFLPVGKGENVYTLRFIDKSGNRHIFKTCDKFIEEWETGWQSKDIIRNSFKFRAYGKFDNEQFSYGYLENFNNTNNIFKNGEWILKEIRLEITNLDYSDNIYIGNDCEYNEHYKNIKKYIDTHFKEMIDKPFESSDSEIYSECSKDL